MENILNHISNYPRSIPVETASALISSVCENPDVFSLQDRAAIIDRVNGKACSDDPEPDDKLVDDPELGDTIDYHELSPRQSMFHVENYFPQSIWQKLRDPNLNREVPYLEIAKLLVQLGMHRPREDFWDLLVCALQWATEGKLTQLTCHRETLKAVFTQCMSHMNVQIEAPTEYPMLPNTLAETHPALYHRSYESSDPPILPPSTLDTHTLNAVKWHLG